MQISTCMPSEEQETELSVSLWSLSWGNSLNVTQVAPSISSNYVEQETVILLDVTVAGLRNDHKALMKLMEETLHQIHAEARLRRGAESEGVARGEGERKLPKTFARVSQVTGGSPAATAVSVD